MSSLLSTMHSLREMFDGKLQEFASEVENVHMVWLDEIQQEAVRMFSSDFSAEPELMPKTPSQKKSNRRKRVVGHVDNPVRRRFSRGKRSNLRRSSVQILGLIKEVGGLEEKMEQCNSPCIKQEVDSGKDHVPVADCMEEEPAADPKLHEQDSSSSVSVVQSPSREAAQNTVVTVTLSRAEQQSGALLLAADNPPQLSDLPLHAPCRVRRRSSVCHSLSNRRSLVGLRQSMTRESMRRASRRAFLRKASLSSTASGEAEEDDAEKANQEHVVTEEEPAEKPAEAAEEAAEMEMEEQQTEGRCLTRSMARNSTPSTITSSSVTEEIRPSASGNVKKQLPVSVASVRSNSLVKRQAASPDNLTSSVRKPTPPKKCQSAIRPHMKSFLHTVQKNQLLMSTPNTLGRNSLMKSFIKRTTPLRVDAKEKERLRLEAQRKKQEQENERRWKMEEERKRRQEEMKRKREERMRKVVEARIREEQKEEERKKKTEQKMAMIEEKLRAERLAEEKAKKRVASKRQEELEQRRRQEEEARRRRIQQEEEEERRRQQELLAKRQAEEEQEKARKLAEAQRALELKKEQDRLEQERLERLRQRQLAAERERERLAAVRKEFERAAREKERKEAEERRLKEEQEHAALQKRAEQEAAAMLQKQTAEQHLQSVMKTPAGKAAVMNMTVDIEKSPQSYEITPKGKDRPVVISTNPDDYGMDQNSEDSTDDESAPRKPIPAWAEGRQLHQALLHQYFNPVDVDSYFGSIEDPKLEQIFYKRKPRYFKRTSSAVWHSPPL